MNDDPIPPHPGIILQPERVGIIFDGPPFILDKCRDFGMDNDFFARSELNGLIGQEPSNDSTHLAIRKLPLPDGALGGAAV